MLGKNVYLTKEGYEKFSKELKKLKGKKRKEISEEIKKAREFGDISENAEYDAAKEAQAMNEKRISKLEDKLSRAKIIENLNIPEGEVRVGAKVKLKNLDKDDLEEYIIVSDIEAELSKKKISLSSPIGKGLLGYKENDVVEIGLPNGKVKYKILNISR